MKTKTKQLNMNWAERAFTLIEMLVVIAIIAILAGLIFPAIATAKVKAKIAKAKLEMKDLETAIKAYEAEYNRFPASKKAEDNANPDYTYGPQPLINVPGYPMNNSELIEILLDLDKGANLQHARNPRRHSLFHAKMVSGNSSGVSTDDDIFRDPWGNPYIVTMDMNGDENCADFFYSKVLNNDPSRQAQLAKIGLTIESSSKLNLLHGNVMVWSLGPDGQANQMGGATEGANADNILGWQ